VTDNLLYYGDNLDVLRQYVADDSVDLVYLDPPFKSDQDYNVLFAGKDGTAAAAQIEAFEDTWHWDSGSAQSFTETVEAGGPVSDVLQAFEKFLGTNDMLAYLAMMAPRIKELYRVLRPTGSLYLHCDPTASHYLKLLLDAVFGVERFQNEIVWKRTSAHNDPKRFGRIADRLLFYSKSRKKTFNPVMGELSPAQLARYKYKDEQGLFKAEQLTAPHFSPTRTVEWRGVHPGGNRQWRFGIDELERLYAAGRILLQADGRPRKDGLKEYLDESEGAPAQDIWTDIVLGPTAGERLGYPTQKPRELLERIVGASSNPGDVVLDPFCGCGTTIFAAQELDRRWIGIDITIHAVALIEKSLREAYKDEVVFATVGVPTTMEEAIALAERDKFQFQWWAAYQLGAVGEQKKGPDKGVDGRIVFKPDDDDVFRHIVISVKAGKLKATDVRDLRGVMERDKADIGVLVSMSIPSRQMRAEAASAGLFKTKWGDYPRLQLITVDDLLAGKRIDYPKATNRTTKIARRSPRKSARQLGIPLDADSTD
jgi:DNA modification methylase